MSKNKVSPWTGDFRVLVKFLIRWPDLTYCGDIDVCVVEEEHVDGAANAYAILAQSVVVLALWSQNGLLLVGSLKLRNKKHTVKLGYNEKLGTGHLCSL